MTRTVVLCRSSTMS